jgi:hypothetical protein
MTTFIDSERSNRILLTLIAIVGAVLCVIGWYRYLA